MKKLLAEVRRCTLCAEHLAAGPRPVLQASPSARILIAGQAPGRKVHESGVPFDDASGDRLRDWLGVSPEQFYDTAVVAILPMGFCYPGTGKSGDLAPRKECAPAWREQLLAAMPNIQLTVVIGQYALRWHASDRKGSLTEAVKDWRRDWPNQIPLPHPSPRNNIWLSKNDWFEGEVLPSLRRRVRQVLR